MTRPHKFYKISESTTGRYVNMSKLNISNTMGFQMQSQMVKEHACLNAAVSGTPTENNSYCFDGKFLQIITLNQNYWNYENDLENVGGILALGLDTCK